MIDPFHHLPEDAIIERAQQLLKRRLQTDTILLSSTSVVSAYLTHYFSRHTAEEFGIITLNCQHRLIAHHPMFKGTLSQTSVYPREVVRQALFDNAASVILTHNHPGGIATPSQADHALTRALGRALSLIEVTVVEHLIIAGNEVYSFAAHGQLMQY